MTAKDVDTCLYMQHGEGEPTFMSVDNITLDAFAIYNIFSYPLVD